MKDDMPDWWIAQQWSMPSRRCTFRMISSGPLCNAILNGSECGEHGERGIERTQLELQLSYAARGDDRWVHLSPPDPSMCAPSQVNILDVLRLTAEDYRNRYRMAIREETT